MANNLVGTPLALKTSGLLLLGLLLVGCSGEENSPDMGAVPPKPNPKVMENVPGATPGALPPDPGADARAMGGMRGGR